MSINVLPMFSSKSFIVSGLTFMSLIHGELVFVYDVRNILISLFQRIRTNNLKFIWNHKRSWIAKSILRKITKWNCYLHRFQIILQRCSNQNSMILAQKRTHRSIEQKRKSGDKSTHIWAINPWQKWKEYTMVKWHSLQQLPSFLINSAIT